MSRCRRRGDAAISMIAFRYPFITNQDQVIKLQREVRQVLLLAMLVEIPLRTREKVLAKLLNKYRVMVSGQQMSESALSYRPVVAMRT